MKPTDEALVSFRLRTIRIGAWTTLFVLASLTVYILLPGRGRIDTVPYLEVALIATMGVLVVALLPWKSLLASGAGHWLLYAWGAFHIVLIAEVIALTRGVGIDLFFLYAFTMLTFAAGLPLRGQIALLVLTFASYVAALGVTGWGIGAAEVALKLGLLAVLGVLAIFLSRELGRQMAAREEDRAEMEQRADLLATVARAARRVSALESERVLEAVVEGASTLGFEAANLAVYDEDSRTYQVAHGLGLPKEYVQETHPATEGMPGLVLERRGTVVVDDYAVHPNSIPRLRDAGFHSVIATPVWVAGRLAAALVGRTHERRRFTSQDVEAFELLAALAGRALENARRYEDEHRTVERLAELDRLKSDFISTVSHELRTPLTAIEGMGLTLDDQWDVLDEGLRRELLGRLNANARTLHQIISTLLDFSRIEAGRMEVNIETVRVREHMEGVASRLHALTATHEVAVDVPHGLTAEADPMLLDRVVENLLSNAVKHTPPGTSVLLSARAEGKAAVVSVSDTGPGIPSDELRYLGDRFFRGGDPNTRRTRGTGLGLALVREILQLHGTELRVESEVGRGSRFSFRLPLAETSPAIREAGDRAAS